MMLGGVIRGYCATGRVNTATAPVNVMTMDRTAAKIGRSMKKRENNAGHPLQEERQKENGKRQRAKGKWEVVITGVISTQACWGFDFSFCPLPFAFLHFVAS
jgi:hypothetical protein